MQKNDTPRVPTMTYKYLLLVLIACLTVLGLIEMVASVLYNSIWFPSSYTEVRNTYFIRGWTPYTAVNTSDETEEPLLIIVIANSQGFLQEVADENLTYSHQLELILEDKFQKPVRVLNWSAVASLAAEQIILAARAIEHHPDHILWIIHDKNLESSQFHSLDYYSTDVTHLAYEPSVRQYLSPEFLSAHDAYDPLAWLKANTGIGRLQHVFEKERFMTWSWVPEINSAGTHKREWDDKAKFYAKEFYDTVHRGDPQIPISFVSMPLDKKYYSDEEWADTLLLAQQVNEVYAPLENVSVFDAIQVIPAKMFYTNTHMRAEGHRMFAEWLAEHLF